MNEAEDIECCDPVRKYCQSAARFYVNDSIDEGTRTYVYRMTCSVVDEVTCAAAPRAVLLGDCVL